MTPYQELVAAAYLQFGPRHNVIARAIGGTPEGVRSTLRKLREKGLGEPDGWREEWPVPRP